MLPGLSKHFRAVRGTLLSISAVVGFITRCEGLCFQRAWQPLWYNTVAWATQECLLIQKTLQHLSTLGHFLQGTAQSERCLSLPVAAAFLSEACLGLSFHRQFSGPKMNGLSTHGPLERSLFLDPWIVLGVGLLALLTVTFWGQEMRTGS